MFKLLRRSKKKKSQDNQSGKNGETQNNLQDQRSNALGAFGVAGGSRESYRQFNEIESEADTARRPHFRAAIEELEDLRDLDEDGGDEDEDEIAMTTTATTATTHRYSDAVNAIYFEKCRGESVGIRRRDGAVAEAGCIRERREREKVNLAKTAANFTPNVALTAVDDRNRGSSGSGSSSGGKRKFKSNSAFSKFDVDKINRIGTASALVAGDDHDDNGTRFSSNANRSSHNEPAEWQGRVQPTGNRATLRTAAINSLTDNFGSKRINTTDDLRQNDGEAVAVATTTRPTISSSGPADTVINEVKYRNLGNLPTVKSETKRQSRLSLTFGLGRSTNVNSNIDAVQGRVTSTSELGQRAVRKSFFGNKSKNHDKEEKLNANAASRPNSKLFFQGEPDRKLRPLQKGREFLSDIFMARGRNHNRNRNHHQPQPQPQPTLSQQHQQLQQQLPSQGTIAEAEAQGEREYQCIYPAITLDRSSNHTMNGNYCYNQNTTDTDSPLYSTHLETISHLGSGASTNSYQMTGSNNSPKNLSQIGADQRVAEHNFSHPHQQRNNSAEHVRAGSTESSGERQRRMRSLSREHDASAGASANKAIASRADGAGAAERHFIHAANTEQNAVTTTGAAKELRQTTNANRIESESATAHSNVEIRGAGCGPTARRQFNELTECDRDSLLQQRATSDAKINERGAGAYEWDEPMGQTNRKPETPSRDSIPREFRESIGPEKQTDSCNDCPGRSEPKSMVGAVPKITVVDYSSASDGKGRGAELGQLGSPVEQEVFYDFENITRDAGVNITAIDESSDEEVDEDEDDDDSEDDEVFEENAPAPAPEVVQQHSKWQVASTRPAHAKLENVPEQEEDEEDEEEEEDDEDEEEEDGDDDVDDAGHLDSQFPRGHNGCSPDRNAQKSANTSDSNLSASFPDSGMGDSQASSASSSPTTKHSHSQSQLRHTGDNGKTSAVLRRSPATTTVSQNSRSPFVRDGYSTDCDETLMQCDDLEYVTEREMAASTNERLVCIESISLPDVVVESTTGSSNSNTPAASMGASGDQIVNINGATGNSMGNVHFIPIHVEGSDTSNTQKRRSFDDSGIGMGNGAKKSFANMNGFPPKTTIEIIEDADDAAEKLKQELLEQKSSFNVQLEDAQKNVHNLQSKVNGMQTKIDQLEQELSTKAWHVERLEGELIAAQRDDEFVRKKLKLLEVEKTHLRHKFSESEDEFKQKHDELELQYEELMAKYKQTQILASNLQTQLAAAQSEAEEWRQQVEKIRAELEEQMRILQNALDNSEAERKICQDKWQKEFEMLRTQNQDREETLMTDCEWQMRQMQKQCKEKLDRTDSARRDALEKAEILGVQLEERSQKVENLKVYEAEVKSLRSVVSEQEQAIKTLMEQIENLKVDLQTANENLEEQIKAVKKIKYQCDNTLYDKERQVIYRIDEVRNQAAAFWEDKLYTEMTRLKNELESVYVDDRREALDKLQEEHIEELRALTTRYTANEEELRAELAEVQERFDSRNEEFFELREKSDNSFMQTRMQLDRADREYQNAMCREEERREALEESLRKQFEAEKIEMEEKFRERLGQVKEEFAKELQSSTKELTEVHHNELAQQKAKLQAEKDTAMQEISDRHRKKLAAADERMKDIEIRHQDDLKDLKAAYDTEKTCLDRRDISNANEIEQLHRKCRCLTNLFEEMRMRYERRDPRPEDLREISELRSRCESQERDLYLLTDRLREMQIQMSELQQNGENASKKNMKIKKPPPKSIPTNCDVIYEENEERDSPPPPTTQPNGTSDDYEDDSEEESNLDDQQGEQSAPHVIETSAKIDIKLGGKTKNANIDTINEDDSRMITAV